MNWYALFVESGKEETVQRYLQYHFGNKMLSLIPKRKIPEKKEGKYHSVLKKLFPGYVLLNVDMDTDKYHIIKHIPRLIKILGNGLTYSHIDGEEISVILRLVGCNGVIDYSSIYIENSVVYVKDGPLKGLEGLIKKIDRHTNRAKVQINFMREPRLIDIGIEMLYAPN